MAFRRGRGSVEVELANVQSCLENLDPIVERHTEEIGELKSFQNNTEGKFTVIVWLVGINVSLVIGGLVALFGWGLSHLHLFAY